ncbi:MAG: hypothetical protein JWP03_1372 [Phycisphaerales bacterium]|jgi:hypothetical protein|nr:hypothetical protein [Phycisphaerales bacterium]
MSDWFFQPSAKYLTAVEQAQAEFRNVWNQLKPPPFAAPFTGEAVDIRAMDYLDYEGIDDPPCGIEGAALVWGEVLRRAADMRWVMSYRGDLMLASSDESMLMCPFPRVFEVKRRSIPQFGKYQWAMEQAIVELIVCDRGEELIRRLLSRIPPDEDGGYTWEITESKQVSSVLRKWLQTSRGG